MASAPEADLETRLEDKINADDWGSYYWEYANVVTADNGKQYYYEARVNSPYRTATTGSGLSVSRSGCFLYALSSAISAQTNKLYTVREILEGVGANLEVKNGKITAENLSRVGASEELFGKITDENVALSYSIENTNLNTIEDALTYGSTACVYSDDSTDPGNVFHRVSRNWGNSWQNGWRIHRV